MKLTHDWEGRRRQQITVSDPRGPYRNNFPRSSLQVTTFHPFICPHLYSVSQKFNTRRQLTVNRSAVLSGNSGS